ncbi:hypothetical protein [Cohnella thailandensis]|uniref:Uncharacterized protein n=1 Tax=Cohnella thailandensis TaxID=557557 RepID=A0A841SUB3_9BACL|nr:hypothetical protein [Cohnella thailandensis]MBB6634186.1 hypothetical protein [Cohnella thailandensis]MBP1972316.1 hypothetical protein [Cohnella thailandensis]
MNVLKWFFIILLYPIMFVMMVLTLIMPFMAYDDLKNVLTYEVPSSGSTLTMVGFCSFFIYLAMKSKWLGMPYRKITILLPMLQMIIYTSLALAIGGTILNKWADQAMFSKGTAIALALLAFVAIRLFLSFLYWKNPIAQRKSQ